MKNVHLFPFGCCRLLCLGVVFFDFLKDRVRRNCGFSGHLDFWQVGGGIHRIVPSTFYFVLT